MPHKDRPRRTDSKWPQYPNTMPSPRAMRKAEASATLPENKIVVGVQQHSETGLYQVWFSLYGGDVTAVSAFRDEMKALADMHAVQEMLPDVAARGGEAVATYLQILREDSDQEPRPFTADDLAAIEQTLKKAGVKE